MKCGCGPKLSSLQLGDARQSSEPANRTLRSVCELRQSQRAPWAPGTGLQGRKEPFKSRGGHVGEVHRRSARGGAGGAGGAGGLLSSPQPGGCDGNQLWPVGADGRPQVFHSDSKAVLILVVWGLDVERQPFGGTGELCRVGFRKSCDATV